MNYIYDILLNFNKKLYDFYDWEIHDKIEHIRKIPLIKVNSKTLFTIRNNKVKLDMENLNKIKGKTELFTNKDISTIEYAVLLSDGSSNLALKLNNEGITTQKSNLLIDEEAEIIEIAGRLKEQNIKYKVIEPETPNHFKTRNEQKKEQYIIEELKRNEKNLEKLQYLYFEFFGKQEEQKDKIIKELMQAIQQNENQMNQKIYDFFKLSSISK